MGKALRLDEGDEQYKSYAERVNSAVFKLAVKNGKAFASEAMSGTSHVFECAGLRVEYLDSDWGNDHYYVIDDGEFVYHCQDTPGRMTLQLHAPGDWFERLESMLG